MFCELPDTAYGDFVHEGVKQALIYCKLIDLDRTNTTGEQVASKPATLHNPPADWW